MSKLRLVSVLLSFGLLDSAFGITNYPAWWVSRGVVNTNAAVTNDHAAANLGQLKAFATNAYNEFQANLPNGAGTNVANLVAGFSVTNNYVPVNIGQLKTVAKPFYDRLIAEGYTNYYPWTSNTTDDLSYAAANLGQLKTVFAFDLTKDNDGDGLANWVETGTGIYISPYNTGSNPNLADTDSDGTGDGSEVQNRTDPNNNDTTKPTVAITLPANNSQWTVLP